MAGYFKILKADWWGRGTDQDSAGGYKKSTWRDPSAFEILGWLEGFEPSNVRVTVVSVDRFTIATIIEF